MATLNVKGFSKESRALVERMEAQGWTFRLSSRNHAIGRGPDGTSTMSIGSRLRPGNRAYQNALAEVERWERADALRKADAALELGGETVDRLGTVVSAYLREDDPVLSDVLERAADKHADRVIKALADSVAEPATSTPRGLDGDVRSSSTVESRRPWHATRGRGTYESKAVEEIVRESEVVGYGCTKCDRTADTPHFIASHYKRAHSFRKGRQPQEPTTGRSEGYQPSERLIRALMEYLVENGDMGGLEETAIAALTWMSTRPDLPDPEPHGPLTDAQIIERIRGLVGGRDVALEEQYADLLREHSETVEHLNAVVGERDAALREVERLQSDLDTWLSLAPRHTG